MLRTSLRQIVTDTLYVAQHLFCYCFCSFRSL